MVIDIDIHWGFFFYKSSLLFVIKSLTPDCILSSLANNLLVSVTDACRRLEDVGHTSVPLVWAGLDVAFRVWLH